MFLTAAVCRCVHLSVWDRNSESFWLIFLYVYDCVFLTCVNLFVCPSHISVVGHFWIGMVTKITPPFSFPMSALWGSGLTDAWLCSYPPTNHPHPPTQPPHPPMNPYETAACFLPLKRLETQTVWVPPAARQKIPKPGCTLCLPVVMATSSLITTACFHSDLSGLWNRLISETCSTMSPYCSVTPCVLAC